MQTSSISSMATSRIPQRKLKGDQVEKSKSAPKDQSQDIAALKAKLEGRAKQAPKKAEVDSVPKQAPRVALSGQEALGLRNQFAAKS